MLLLSFVFYAKVSGRGQCANFMPVSALGQQQQRSEAVAAQLGLISVLTDAAAHRFMHPIAPGVDQHAISQYSIAYITHSHILGTFV